MSQLINIIFSVLYLITFVRNSNEAILKVSVPDDGRIVGGKVISINERPYIVSVKRFGFHSCGGSIISDCLILTAAHCLTGVEPSHLTILAGSNVTVPNGGNAQIVAVKKIIIHPQYNRRSLENDIGLLVLEGNLNFSDSVSKIDLPESNEIIPADSLGIISGWGLLEENGKWHSSIKLNTVTVTVISNYMCNYIYWNGIKPTMFCAGDLIKGGKDSCQGDSGGPCEINNKLSGIVSWGYGCARPGAPGVYTRVSSYIDWISSWIDTCSN